MILGIDDSAVAVVGIAGRFPGAGSISELWDLLKDGKEALSYISPEELLAAGFDKALIEDPTYVKCCMRLDGADFFDAEFFGYSPRQAASIDPQQRVFLECAWEAIESAGCDLNSKEESVGVFAGSGFIGHLFDTFVHQPAGSLSESLFERILDNDKDFLTARVAYKLGLTGPSITVQTACSTSLVAVHLACQSLLTGECDMALAGGVSISSPSRGYRYVEHGILSPDGHCRAFDAEANGTVLGSGAGVVVLRRLADALKNGYQIHAIIKSSVVNNDGSQKVGFTAPGLSAQRQLLAKGLALAELHPSDIGYIEAHGTGTVLGDSIELTALNEVYGSSSRSCALGSIKTNIGHLDVAAGVAGMIKAILCLKKRALVPSLGCKTANPILKSPGCPFYVNTTLRQWDYDGNRPLRAAVSSFGMGGTNAHVILEEAPKVPSDPNGEAAQALPLSARTLTALDRAAQNLANFLKQNPDTNIADIAYTLQVGRKNFPYRRVVVDSNSSGLIAGLQDHSREQQKALDNRPVVFLFPCEGSLQPGTLKNLYQTEKYFREELDQCSSHINAHLGFDIRRFLCDGEIVSDIKTPRATYTQLALFAVEYCLARFWLNWRVAPSIMLGNGLGEYVAACISQVISIEDVTRLVIEHAKLAGQLQDNKRIVVDLSEERLHAMLAPQLVVTAVNSPTQCIVAGPGEPLDELICELESKLIGHHRLEASQDRNSPALQPGVAALRRCVSTLNISEPKLPYISCVTGAFVSNQQVKDPAYWEQPLLRPLRISKALGTMQDLRGAVLLEIGPGCALSETVRDQLGSDKDLVLLPSLRNDAHRVDLLDVLGKLWIAGVVVDWNRLHDGHHRRRVELPTYPFDRRQCTPQTAVKEEPKHPKRGTDISPERRFYIPSWKDSLPWMRWKDAKPGLGGLWMVFEDKLGFGAQVTEELRAAGCEVVTVVASSSYERVKPDRFLIDPADPGDYVRLISRLKERGNGVWRIVHCWSLTNGKKESRSSNEEHATVNGYLSLLFLTQALSQLGTQPKRMILAVTMELFDVTGEEGVNSVDSAIPAICTVASQEIANLRCGVTDLPSLERNSTLSREWIRHINAVLAEVSMLLPDPLVAYRGSHRFVRAYEQVRLDWDMPRVRNLREKGVYLITGGLGGIGLALGQDLARRCHARLVLMTRSSFPERVEWDGILSQPHIAHSVVRRIHAVRKMEEAGAEVFIATADVSDRMNVQSVLSQTLRRFGQLNGVFHLAGDLSHQSLRRPIAKLERRDINTQARPKVGGFNILDGELRDENLDFGVVFSSNSSILGGVGFGAYAPANAILDRLVLATRGSEPFRWVVTNWDGWSLSHEAGDQDELDPFSVTADEGLDALWRIVCLSTSSQVVVSKSILDERLDTWVRQQRVFARGGFGELQAQVEGGQPTEKASLVSRTALERSIVRIWEELLGVDDIGVEGSFLDLGGDSLIALRIIARVRELVGVSVPPSFFVDLGCTVEGLAKKIVTTLVASHDTETLRRHLELTG